MTELEPPEISGYTIFCDDIRFEQDGKVTLVGMYHGVMIIRAAEFPITIPKFALSVVFTQRKTIFERKLFMRVSLPGDKDEEPSFIVEIEPPAEMPIAGNSDRPNISARANLIMSPLTIAAPGKMKVGIERRGELHPVGTLEIQGTITSSNESQQPS
jgi:hypothetical protein